MIGEFRNTIKSEGINYDELADSGYDDGKELLLPESTIKGVLDAIEDDVNKIAGLLEDVVGLSEIDEVKEKLKDLSYKLY